MLGYREGSQGVQEGNMRIIVGAEANGAHSSGCLQGASLGKTASLPLVSSEDLATQFLLCSGK